MPAGLPDAVGVGRDVIGDIGAILRDHDADDTGPERHEVERVIKPGAGVEAFDRGDIHHLVAGRDLAAGDGTDVRVAKQAGEGELGVRQL